VRLLISKTLRKSDTDSLPVMGALYAEKIKECDLFDHFQPNDAIFIAAVSIRTTPPRIVAEPPTTS